MVTCSIDVKVGGLVGHVAGGLETRAPGLHLIGVTHVLGHIHLVGTLVYILSSKEHFHLGG